MKTLMSLVVTVCCISLGFGALRSTAEEATGSAAEKKASVAQSVFVCPDCHTMALQAGTCAKCEKKLQEKHVLAVKEECALLCKCGPTCKCKSADMKEGKCGCGEEVVKVSVKGKYVCEKGCPEIKDKPGTCACGKELKKVE